MQEIEQGIFINNYFPGVTIGAIALPYGALLIDAPPHPDDGRSWLSMLSNMGIGVGRLTVSLDAHPDRTIGMRALDTPVLAHINAIEVLDNRPTIFKGQNPDTGSEWELCDGLSGIRWVKPSMFFTEQAILEWGDSPIILEHHPGPAPGASWLIVPDASVVFIGDAVPIDQPPFMAEANIDQWVETLDELLAPRFKNYLFVSSRGGLVERNIIREQRRFLKEVEKRLVRLFEREAAPEETYKTVDNLLSRFDFPPERHSLYTQRLNYGLEQYYINHYLPPEEEEE